jgi:hypothetical protein
MARTTRARRIWPRMIRRGSPSTCIGWAIVRRLRLHRFALAGEQRELPRCACGSPCPRHVDLDCDRARHWLRARYRPAAPRICRAPHRPDARNRWEHGHPFMSVRPWTPSLARCTAGKEHEPLARRASDRQKGSTPCLRRSRRQCPRETNPAIQTRFGGSRTQTVLSLRSRLSRHRCSARVGGQARFPAVIAATVASMWAAARLDRSQRLDGTFYAPGPSLMLVRDGGATAPCRQYRDPRSQTAGSTERHLSLCSRW